jgi:hypothetical protein
MTPATRSLFPLWPRCTGKFPMYMVNVVHVMRDMGMSQKPTN